MWIYIVISVICVVLCKKLMDFVSAGVSYWNIARAVGKFPLHEDNHWLFGLTHLAEDFAGVLKILQAFVDRTGLKWFHAWNACLYPCLQLVHPQTLKAFLTANNIPKNHGMAGAYRMLLPWIGDGLLVSGGKKWERNRRLLTPALHFNVLRPYINIYHDVADILLKKLSALGTGEKSLDICPLISRATLDTMVRCTLSYESESIQSTGSDQHPYVKSVERLKSLIMKRAMNPFVYNDFLYSLTADSKEFKKHCNFVHEFSSNIIQARKMSLEDDPSLVEKRNLDLVDILITAKDEKGVGLTEQEIRDEVDTFMFAGHDTTASAIMWVLYSLAKYPGMQQRVREDVEEVLQGRRRLEIDDLPRLNYTTRFIKESLRMHTPVPAVTRKLTEPVTVEGVTFPPGSVIDLHPHLMHHNPSVWENHTKFDPDRFTQENFAKKDPFAFLPFSAGQRNCIGQNFAMNEIKTLVSRIIMRFQIIRDEEREAIPYPELVMNAKDGIYLHFKEL